VGEQGEGGSSDSQSFLRLYEVDLCLGLASKAVKKENELQIGLAYTRTNKQQMNKPRHVHQHPYLPEVGQSRPHFDVIAMSTKRDSLVQW